MLTPFADYIESMPGLTDNARSIYLRIDAEAVKLGVAIKASHPPAHELRSLARMQAARGLGWLADKNNELADALDQDVRLAGIPTLYAWAQAGDLDRCWITWWADFVRLHIEHERARPRLVAAE